MQKTEKHCKNQCFCYHKTTKISPKTGPKTQKSASGPGHLRNRKKRCCKPKNWGQKVEKHGVFSLFACRFWTGAFTNRCLPYCFLQCFLKASVTTYQKQEVLAEKCPAPPGKPVTFYECHPEDHAPAPSVRADLYHIYISLSLSLPPLSIYLSTYLSIYLAIYPSIHPSIYLSIYLSIHVQTAYQELAAELEKQTPNPWDLDNWEARLSRSRMRSWELGCTNGWS